MNAIRCFFLVIMLSLCGLVTSAFAIMPTEIFGFWKSKGEPYRFESEFVKFPGEEEKKIIYTIEGNDIVINVNDSNEIYRVEIVNNNELKMTSESNESLILIRIDESEWTGMKVFNTKKMKNLKPTPIEF